MAEKLYEEKDILAENCTNPEHRNTGVRLASGNKICVDCRREIVWKKTQELKEAFRPLKDV